MLSSAKVSFEVVELSSTALEFREGLLLHIVAVLCVKCFDWFFDGRWLQQRSLRRQSTPLALVHDDVRTSLRQLYYFVWVLITNPTRTRCWNTLKTKGLILLRSQQHCQEPEEEHQHDLQPAAKDVTHLLIAVSYVLVVAIAGALFARLPAIVVGFVIIALGKATIATKITIAES